MKEKNKQEFRVEFVGARLTGEQVEAIEKSIQNAVAACLAKLDLADQYRQQDKVQAQMIDIGGGFERGMLVVRESL